MSEILFNICQIILKQFLRINFGQIIVFFTSKPETLWRNQNESISNVFCHFQKPNNFFFIHLQLKTVMERCEKIPPEAFESRNRSNLDSEKPRVWPSVDREGKTLGDVEYIVPSPPERESIQTKTLSPSDLEAYVRSYQEPPLSQV